jgi:hypothetical protein
MEKWTKRMGGAGGGEMEAGTPRTNKATTHPYSHHSPVVQGFPLSTRLATEEKVSSTALTGNQRKESARKEWDKVKIAWKERNKTSITWKEWDKVRNVAGKEREGWRKSMAQRKKRKRKEEGRADVRIPQRCCSRPGMRPILEGEEASAKIGVMREHYPQAMDPTR